MKKYIVIIDLHCDPTIPSGAGDIGGGNTYSRSLLQELQKHEVFHIYITRKKYPYLEEYINMTPYSEFYRIDLGDWGPIDKDVLQNYYSLSKKHIIKILSSYNNCSFIFHSSYWQSGMLAYTLAKEYNTFYVHTILSNAKKKQLTGAIDDIVEQRIKEEEKIFSNAQYLICSSLSEVSEMQSLYSIAPQKLIMAGLKVDNHYLFPPYNSRGEVRINTIGNTTIKQQYLSYFSKCHESDNYLWWNRKNYIYFGRIHKNKGIKEIILAWSQVYELMKEKVPDLWIVGGAPSQIEQFRNSIKESIPQLEKYEQQHHIIWWGTLPPEGISTLLLKSSVLVTHSKYEAGGLVLLEALSQGIPVIATPNGYGKDYLHNWYNGFIVDYNDIDSLCQKLIFFCNQPFLTDYMGRNARYSAEKIEQTYNFFHSHMYAYGLESKQEPLLHFQENIDWYQKITSVPMDTYPYLTELLSQNNIIQIMNSCTHCQVFDIKEIGNNLLDYKLWEINTDDGIYCFAYYYDIINTTNIWNPYSTEEYVLTKAERVNAAVELFIKMNDSSIIYKNTACGYIIYKGALSEKILTNNIVYNSDEDEIATLNLKISELLDLLKSPLMNQYNIFPIINYVLRLKENIKTEIVPQNNISFVSIKCLSFMIETNLNIVSYDKLGLCYKNLIRAPKKVDDSVTAFDLSCLSIQQLWTIYFELYSYVECLLIYSKDEKTDFIEDIYKI